MEALTLMFKIQVWTLMLLASLFKSKLFVNQISVAINHRKAILRARNHKGKIPGAGRRVNLERSRMRRAID